MSAKESAFKAAEMGDKTGALMILGMGLISSIGLLPVLAIIGVVGALSVFFLPLVIWGGSTLIVTGVAYTLGMKPRYAILAGVGTGFLAFIAVQTMGVSILSATGMSSEASKVSSIPTSVFLFSLAIGGLAWLKLYETTK